MSPIQKFAKLAEFGTRHRSGDSGPPSITKVWLKIQTSNLVPRLTTRSPIQKFAKLGQIGTRPGSRDLLLNFGPTSITKERLKQLRYKLQI